MPFISTEAAEMLLHMDPETKVSYEVLAVKADKVQIRMVVTVGVTTVMYGDTITVSAGDTFQATGVTVKLQVTT